MTIQDRYVWKNVGLGVETCFISSFVGTSCVILASSDIQSRAVISESMCKPEGQNGMVRAAPRFRSEQCHLGCWPSFFSSSFSTLNPQV